MECMDHSSRIHPVKVIQVGAHIGIKSLFLRDK